MDFWSRLIANTRLSSGSSSKDAARDPIRRRQRFEKEYGQLLQIWRNCSNIARDEDAAENIELRLQGLTNILADESRRPLPHPCVSFSATKQIYVPIAKIATSSYNEWIIKEAVLFFATLIESEEEAFVESDTFSASLTNLLVRITGVNSIRLGPDTEVKVVELAFNITTKIRLEPRILSAWFKSRPESHANEEKAKDQREKFAGRIQKQDFPLFYLLMDYIHHEGKIGDFARTGLLYIIEAASSSVALEQWIVESDLSTLMATGLGALYSQLSRKLVIDHPPENLPPVLALSDYQHPTSTFEIVSSCSPDFQLHLETFLSHLLFWQDVLNHCRSGEVKSTLLEHFQVIFLQQLLYPSLLESSDVDGGSSVAVLTYLRRILEALDHPDMINLILHYLLALPDAEASAPADAEPSVSAARKRKSMDLATMMATKVESSYTPLLFNLVDLIRSCLKSRNQQTVCVTLQLVAAILKRHHRYATTTLLHTEGIDTNTSRRTVGAHEQEVEFLTTLAGSVGGQDNFNEIYENILKDSMARVEGHPCSLKLVTPNLPTTNTKLPIIPDSLPGAPGDVPPHTLSAEDPLWNSILDILESFFINPVEMNLSATETILDLAVCGYISVEGWLMRHPRRYSYEGETDESISLHLDPESALFAETEKLQAITKCRRRPVWQLSSLPRIFTVLETLADQVDYFRSSVPRFEELLQQRREAFQTADAIVPNPGFLPASTTGASIPDQASQDGSRATSPQRPSALEGFAQRILSEFGSPGRTGSPRGRKETIRGSSTGSGTSGGYGVVSPTPKPMPPPKEFPLNYDDPSKSGVARSLSPGSQHSGKDGAVVNQAAAFAAVDQGILARQVSLPAQKIEPIPLDFERKNTDISTDADREQGGEDEGKPDNTEDQHSDSESEAANQSIAPTPPETPLEVKTASVSHILTNIIIYQQFLLELASLVQVRASLFNEVKFA
ncbi:Retinoic acid induced 16-like protein-domain-containing protein [Daldinia caldariorum]|uniref:Retinoic acid induced 16-like protein-domain-containing protein n=1 Tax=Daldinia caldariorum TaxID=326644 RepID=UPI0020071F37|nr:Retinoic acid induced 16-like protein-domain-containing protein [Daldinia caldariorum]KAI1464458.1 Retinoic acid induced 16-like protein-domain-containing protein [Daldinia caldariorum]